MISGDDDDIIAAATDDDDVAAATDAAETPRDMSAFAIYSCCIASKAVWSKRKRARKGYKTMKKD